jgi:hypothetical protein
MPVLLFRLNPAKTNEKKKQLVGRGLDMEPNFDRCGF